MPATRRPAAPRRAAVALTVLLAGGPALLAGCSAAEEPSSGGPRSVILIVGDGMGAAHREIARLAEAGLSGQLAMDALPVTGMQTTDPDDPTSAVTDSAAAATAWATGQKTADGSISVDTDDRPLTTLGREAGEAGLATGLVTTSMVTDATPAAFFANAASRDEQESIARQYLEDGGPQVILGGGEDWWLPADQPGAFPAPEGEQTDVPVAGTVDLVAAAEDQGYVHVTDAAGLERATGEDRVLGLFAGREMFRAAEEGDGDAYEPGVRLRDMTAAALDILSRSEQGFFLVVEEEAVDGFSHYNNAQGVLQAMRALDETVELARSFARHNPDTLVIVTGDHECGGLTIEGLDAAGEAGAGAGPGEDGPFAIAGSDRQVVVDWTTSRHTGAPVPVTAEGPDSEQLAGVYPNTRLHEVMRAALVL